MSEQDVRTRKALALLDHEEAQTLHRVVLDAAAELGREYAGLAELLKSNPANVSLDGYEGIVDFERLSKVVNDVKTADDERVKALDRLSLFRDL